MFSKTDVSLNIIAITSPEWVFKRVGATSESDSLNFCTKLLTEATNQAIDVRVTDVLGRMVSSQQIIPMGYQADVPLTLPAALAPGVYSVTLRASGQLWTTRLVIEPR